MSPETIRWARPSAMAVLPTPGSPIRTGLFFVRRDRTWMTRRISSSRPMTGSSLPSSASCVRSRPNFWSAWYFSSGLWSVTRCGPRTCSMAAVSALWVAPLRLSDLAASPPCPEASASRMCSVEMYSSRSLPASRSARRSTSISSRLVFGSFAPAVMVGSLSSAVLSSAMIVSGRAPSLRSTGPTTDSGCSSSAISRCSGCVSVWLRAAATAMAACSASWDLIVKRSACIQAVPKSQSG